MNGLGIQYPSPQSMNPLSQIQSGVATGMQLSGMMQKRKEQPVQPSNAVLPDPGPRQFVNPAELLKGVTADLRIVEEYDKKMKGLTPEQRYVNLNRLVDSGVIKTDMMKTMIRYTEIKPSDMKQTLIKIINNDPTAQADLGILLDEAGGGSTQLKQEIGKVMNQAQAIQKQMDDRRGLVLHGTLDRIFELLDDPRKFEGKSGIMNPITSRVVQNWPNYIKEWSQIDPEGAKAFLEDKQKAQAAKKGYKPTVKLVMDYKGRYGTFINGRLVKGEKSTHPDFEMKGVVPISQTDFAYLMMHGKLPERTELGKEPKPEIKEPEESIIDKIKGAAKGLYQKILGDDELVEGQIYEDEKGNKAKYLGNGKWQPVK